MFLKLVPHLKLDNKEIMGEEIVLKYLKNVCFVYCLIDGCEINICGRS